MSWRHLATELQVGKRKKSLSNNKINLFMQFFLFSRRDNNHKTNKGLGKAEQQ